MKIFITSLILLNCTSIFTGNPCEKCSIEKVKVVNDNLDSLTFQMVEEFLCTFDTSCFINVEYSEWSNEILFRVLEKSTSIFFQVIVNGQIDNKLLLREIESPILDFDLQKIYDKIKAVNAPYNIKKEYLSALITAASLNEIIIRE